MDVAVEVCRKTSVGFRPDDQRYPGIGQRIAQPVGMERPVGEELAAGRPFDQPHGAARVVRLSGQQAEVDQIATRIRQRDDLIPNPVRADS